MLQTVRHVAAQHRDRIVTIDNVTWLDMLNYWRNDKPRVTDRQWRHRATDGVLSNPGKVDTLIGYTVQVCARVMSTKATSNFRLYRHCADSCIVCRVCDLCRLCVAIFRRWCSVPFCCPLTPSSVSSICIVLAASRLHTSWRDLFLFLFFFVSFCFFSLYITVPPRPNVTIEHTLSLQSSAVEQVLGILNGYPVLGNSRGGFPCLPRGLWSHIVISFPSPWHCLSAAPSLSGATLLSTLEGMAFPYPQPGDVGGRRSATAVCQSLTSADPTHGTLIWSQNNCYRHQGLVILLIQQLQQILAIIATVNGRLGGSTVTLN